MNLLYSLRTASRALRHHKGRSLLTIIGIVIGIGGMVATNAIGLGAQKKAREELLSYGSNSIDIFQGNHFSPNATKEPKPLFASYAQVIQDLVPSVQYASPTLHYETPTSHIAYQGKQFGCKLLGGLPSIVDIRDLELQDGIFFGMEHQFEQHPVIVLEHHTAETLFGWQRAVGNIVEISGTPLVVIGVLKRPKVERRWDNLGKLRAYAPLSVVQKLQGVSAQHVDTIELKIYAGNPTEEASQILNNLMRQLHNLEPHEPNDFTVWSVSEMAAAAEAGAKVIGLFGLIAASIALLVGGIGVMNIMLVSVSERTKEIGIKLALGAAPRIILHQFIIEAILLCLCGGTLGVAAGIGIASALSSFIGFQAIITTASVLIAMLVTMLIGLVFGYYPARRAASMDPVEALIEH